mmetsp:Transcript_16858/g.43196  ORF Transcript_16858/g.43196 Transcript_16858/m.43196 type:complete len:110 (-) Transcript_16858:1211-1540(-)
MARAGHSNCPFWQTSRRIRMQQMIPDGHMPCKRRYQTSVYERRRKRPRRFAANVSRAAGEMSASEGDTPQLDAAALEGISFTPGGLLFPYYCGVSAALNDLGMISSQTR